MAEREDPQEGLERLTEAIVRAILTSEEVMKKIRDLQLGDVLTPSDIVALALRFPGKRGAEVRVDLLRGSREGEPDGPQPPRPGKREHKEEPSSRKLTQNEELFEKYLQDRFDEKEWLKKKCLQFDPNLE
jgi:hypothetical protein